MPDITITLNEQEQMALGKVCDSACRHDGVAAAGAAVSLLMKMQQAQQRHQGAKQTLGAGPPNGSGRPIPPQEHRRGKPERPSPPAEPPQKAD